MDYFKLVFSDDPNPNSSGTTSESVIHKNNQQKHDDDEDDDQNQNQEDNTSSPKVQNSNLISYPSSPMNFFKAVFSADPDPLYQGSVSDSYNQDQHSSPNAKSFSAGGGWNLGGLVKTLATKSESVIETYRRDLKEFGSELKKESEVLREVTSRAVKELPSSIEVGASKAQGSFETVGHVIDELGSTVWKGTSQIISRGKDALLAVDQESDSSETHSYSNQSFNSKQFSRFDVQLRKIQSELSSFRDEPEDLDDFKKWRSGVSLEEKGEEMERLLEENGVMEDIYERIVPNEIDHETFWFRYYYKVYKLEQADDARAKLLQKAISAEDDDDLTWEVDDDDEEEVDSLSAKTKELKDKELQSTSVEESRVGEAGVAEKSKIGDEESNMPTKVALVENKEVSMIPEGDGGDQEQNKLNGNNATSKNIVVDSNADIISNDKAQVEGTSVVRNNDSVEKTDTDESSKSGDLTVVPSKPLLVEEEEDLGWDEIEDLGSDDEKKLVAQGETTNNSSLKKVPTPADDDEDLNWDVEDNDEHNYA